MALTVAAMAAWAAWAAWAGWWGAVDSLFDGMGEGGNKGERRDGKWHWMKVEDVLIVDGKGRGALLVGTGALQRSDGGGHRGEVHTGRLGTNYNEWFR